MWTWLEAIDVWLLVAVQTVLEFLNEWLSLRQRWIERALIVVCGVCMGIRHGLSHEAAVWWVLIVISVVILLLEHRRTNSVRTYWLLQGRGCISRLVTLALCLDTVVEVLLAPVTPESLFRLGEWTAWTLVIFITALPSGGTPGRRRKAAITKIVDQFGREFVPEGAGA